MSIPLKWLPLLLISLGLIIYAAYYFMAQNTTVRTTSEVDFIMQATNVGEVRSHVEDDSGLDQVQFFNKDEVIANLIANVVDKKIAEGYEVKISYAFTDKNDKVTNVEDEITGVYFIVNYLDENKKVISTAEKRIALDIEYK